MQRFPANHGASQLHERLVRVVAPLVTRTQAAVLMQPRQRPFHHPAKHAQAAAVGRSTPGQHRLDAPLANSPAVGLRVVASVALEALRSAARPAGFAAHAGNRVNQWQQLRDIVPIGSRQDRRQRRAAGIGDQVVFRACFSAVNGARPGLRPPKTARNDALSTTARDQSRFPLALSRSSRRRCSFRKTSAFCQSRRRRQQVIPQPQLNSAGKSFHGIPVRITKRMPLRTARSSAGGRPPRLNRSRRRRVSTCGGKSGSTIFHSSSGTNNFGIVPSLATNRRNCWSPKLRNELAFFHYFVTGS